MLLCLSSIDRLNYSIRSAYSVDSGIDSSADSTSLLLICEDHKICASRIHTDITR